MIDLILIIISTALANNLALDYMLGFDPAVAASRRIETALKLCIVMMLIIPITTLLTALLQLYLLTSLALLHLQLVSFVLIITLAIMITEQTIKQWRPAFYARIKLYFPLILMNSAVTGVTIINAEAAYGVLESVAAGLGAAAGFGLVVMMLATLRERIEVADVPAPFRGIAVLLIALGIISMGFMGFTGLVITP